MELTGNVQGLIDLVGGGSDVEYEQILESGEKIGVITIDNVPTDIYAPDGAEVEVTQVLSSGTKIATIEVDGDSVDLYAPTPEEPTSVEVTQVLSSGTKIATIEVDGVDTDLYAPDSSSDGDIYSESEVEIGTFLNNKLYRRVIVLQSPLIINSGAWVTTSIDISFLRFIVRKEFINREDGANTGGGSIVYKTNSGYMEIGNEQKNDSMKFDVIVLEYTK